MRVCAVLSFLFPLFVLLGKSNSSHEESDNGRGKVSERSTWTTAAAEKVTIIPGRDPHSDSRALLSRFNDVQRSESLFSCYTPPESFPNLCFHDASHEGRVEKRERQV